MKMLREIGGAGKIACWATLAALVIGFSTDTKAATISVVLEPDEAVYEVGELVTVDVLATTDDALVGYGFDLLANPASLVSFVGYEASDSFLGVQTPDGDGIAGLKFNGGMAGADLLLGVATFQAEGAGQVTLTPAVTGGDLTEGFARSGNGFLDLSATSAQITIVASLNSVPLPGSGGGGNSPTIPEPATMVLLAAGALLFRGKR